MHLSWVLTLAGLWLAGNACLLSAQTVKDLRMASAVGHTRAVIDLSEPAEYRLFQLRNPDRIVIDFEHARLAEDFQQPSGSGSVAQVRTGRRGDDGLRVVLDLDEVAHPKSFLLEPGQQRGYRLVVDLYADPVLAQKSVPQPKQVEGRDVVVVIDAGHGGDDPGAIGSSGIYEKNITLKVAKRLAKEINAQPGMRAELTRDDDTFIPLKRRYQIARDFGADLFISLHADAFRDKSARGSSVWVLSTDGKVSEAARWLANRENRSDLIGGVSLSDKSDTLAAVLLDLSQGASMGISDEVARNVLQALADVGPTHKRHVEHANFVVLRSPDVPSILVETGFITNPVEERNLRSAAYRNRLAGAIMSGVIDYFRSAPPMGTWFAQQAELRRDGEHVVLRGETLSAIADEYGISVARLQSANDLANANQLKAGLVLRIPAG